MKNSLSVTHVNRDWQRVILCWLLATTQDVAVKMNTDGAKNRVFTR